MLRSASLVCAAFACSFVSTTALAQSQGTAVLTGTVWPDGGKVYNAVVLIDNGRVEAVRYKVDLPNYGVFDEKRVFAQGPMPGPINVRGVRIGVPICEDIWGPDVVECLAECGADILITPNGSPFDWTKPDAPLARAAKGGKRKRRR